MLQLESEMNSDIKGKRKNNWKKSRLMIVININQKLVNQLIETAWQCWTNAQYSRWECLEVVGIPISIPNDLLEVNVSKVFGKLEVHVEGKDIKACPCLKDNNRAFAKFSNRKDSLQILRVKKDLKSLNPTESDWIRLSWGHENLYQWESLWSLK